MSCPALRRIKNPRILGRGLKLKYSRGGQAQFENLFTVAPGESSPFATSGDSGSLIVRDGSTPRAVGLVFYEHQGILYGSPIRAVLEQPRARLGVQTLSRVGYGDGTGDCPESQQSAEAVARAKAVKARHQPAVFQVPGVVGAGIGIGPAIEV